MMHTDQQAVVLHATHAIHNAATATVAAILQTFAFCCTILQVHEMLEKLLLLLLLYCLC